MWTDGRQARDTFPTKIRAFNTALSNVICITTRTEISKHFALESNADYYLFNRKNRSERRQPIRVISTTSSNLRNYNVRISDYQI